MTALAAGCGPSRPKLGVIGHVEGFSGGVAGDEPRAVLVARDVLSAGGEAGDAAVAYFFALAATLPSRAGLGSGGVCLVSRRDSGRVETISFLTPAQPGGPRAVALPGAVRGLFAVHALAGRLRWEQLVFAGERLARFGHPVSRALAVDLAAAWPRLSRDDKARQIFGDAAGGPLKEGALLTQLDLAATLTRIRVAGAGDLYSGQLARRFVEGARELGYSLSVNDLRRFKPLSGPTADGAYGNHIAYFPGVGAQAGWSAAALWAALDETGSYDDTNEAGRPNLMVEAARRVMRATRQGPPPVDDQGKVDAGWAARLMAGSAEATHPGSLADEAALPDADVSTGFAIVDPIGGAVACSLTPGPMFGTGRIVPTTGMFAVEAQTASARASLAPAIVANPHTKDTFVAAAAGGDPSAPLALVSTLLALRHDDATAASALAAPRAYPMSQPGAVMVEDKASEAMRQAFVQRGDRVVPVRSLGRLNIVSCPGGVTRTPKTCTFNSDPRGHGLGSGAEE